MASHLPQEVQTPSGPPDGTEAIDSEAAGKLAKARGFAEERLAVRRHKDKHLSRDAKGMTAERDVQESTADALIKLVSFTTDCRPRLASYQWILT